MHGSHQSIKQSIEVLKSHRPITPTSRAARRCGHAGPDGAWRGPSSLHTNITLHTTQISHYTPHKCLMCWASNALLAPGNPDPTQPTNALLAPGNPDPTQPSNALLAPGNPDPTSRDHRSSMHLVELELELLLLRPRVCMSGGGGLHSDVQFLHPAHPAAFIATPRVLSCTRPAVAVASAAARAGTGARLSSSMEALFPLLLLLLDRGARSPPK